MLLSLSIKSLILHWYHMTPCDWTQGTWCLRACPAVRPVSSLTVLPEVPWLSALSGGPSLPTLTQLPTVPGRRPVLCFSLSSSYFYVSGIDILQDPSLHVIWQGDYLLFSQTFGILRTVPPVFSRCLVTISPIDPFRGTVSTFSIQQLSLCRWGGRTLVYFKPAVVFLWDGVTKLCIFLVALPGGQTNFSFSFQQPSNPGAPTGHGEVAQ